MTDIFRDFRRLVIAALDELAAVGALPAGLDLTRVAVEPPRDPAHGELATNAAMVLAGTVKRNPMALAEEFCQALMRQELASGDYHGRGFSVAAARPGFINIRLASEVWHAQLRAVLRAGPAFGKSTLGGGEPVNVEFVSANPTGPMHVGHGRGAVFGDALAALLAKAGYRVGCEYYVNDAGAQVDILARSLHLRYREALGETVGDIPEGLYPGDYLIETGRELAERDGEKWLGRPEAEWLGPVRDFAIERMLALIRDDLQSLGVRHDLFVSERALVAAGAIDDCLAMLDQRGLIYTGVLDAPKGKQPDDWEPRAQTLFRATQFGDDVDRPLKKSDGSWTYFAADIAYHRDKFRRGFTNMIDVWGADHGGYVKRMQAAVRAVTEDRAALDVKLCQLVHLFDQGQPVRMSKRAGTFVTLREVIDEVGKDVFRFIMLTRRERPDARLRFRQGHRAVEGQSGLLRAVRARPRRLGHAARGRGIPGRGSVGCGVGRGAARPAFRPHGTRADPAIGGLAAAGRECGRGARAAPCGVLSAGGGGAVPHLVEQGEGRGDLALPRRRRSCLEPRPAGAGPRPRHRDRLRSCRVRRDSGRGNVAMSYQFGPADPEQRTDLYADLREAEEALPPRRFLAILVALVVMALFAGGLWVAYTQGARNSSAPSAAGEAPLIKADTRPTKVKPEQPGGMQVPDRDKMIYNQGRGGQARPVVEHLLPPAEKPLPRPTAPPAVPPPAAAPAPVAAAAPTPPPAPPVAETPPTPPANVAKPEQHPAAASGRAPPAAPKPLSPRVQPASAGGGARIQLGSVRSEEQARQEWERIKRRNADLLGGLSATPVRADLGDKGVYYRIQAGPVGDPAKAERICAELKQRNVGCIIAR